MAWGANFEANFECGLKIGLTPESVQSAPRGRPRAYDLLVLTSATYTWFGLIWFNTLSKTIRHRTDARSSHRCRPGRRLGRRAIARARCAPPPRPARVGPS